MLSRGHGVGPREGAVMGEPALLSGLRTETVANEEKCTCCARVFCVVRVCRAREERGSTSPDGRLLSNLRHSQQYVSRPVSFFLRCLHSLFFVPPFPSPPNWVCPLSASRDSAEPHEGGVEGETLPDGGGEEKRLADEYDGGAARVHANPQARGGESVELGRDHGAFPLTRNDSRVESSSRRCRKGGVMWTGTSTPPPPPRS
ncbi:unnamed protein product [Ectocarpus sp. 4 AP-2014]